MTSRSPGHASAAEPGSTAGLSALTLALGVCALSSAAVLIRLSDAPAVVTAFYRVALSALLLGGWLMATRARGAGRLAVGPILIGGTALAFHFWAWMASLELTSVASSTLLVTTTPVWIAAAAPFLRDERALGFRAWLGVAIALAGAAVIGANAGAGNDTAVSLPGLALAVVGAWLMATYLVVSRRARQQMGLIAYAAGANSVAAVVLAVALLLGGHPLRGYDPTTWMAFLGLAVFPQLIGHNALLFALRRVGAAIVSLVVLLEPVGAAILAFFVLGEPIARFEVGGGALLLLGLAVVVRAQADAARSPQSRDVSRETPTG